MATWEEMVNGTLDPNTGQYSPYNPVTAVSERHKALMEQRQAENIARMQAANPGYLPGGNMQGSGQGFQQFAPPSVMANKDAWLESNLNMANENFSQPANPVAQAQATGGMNTTGGLGGGQVSTPSGSSANDPLGFNNYGPDTGLDPAIAGALGWLGGPAFAPALAGMTKTPEENQMAIDAWGNFTGPDDPVVSAFNALADMGFTEASQLADNPEGLAAAFDSLPGVGLPNGGGAVSGGGTNAPGVNNPTGSGFGGDVGGGFSGAGSLSGGSGGNVGNAGSSSSPDGPPGGSSTGGAPGNSAAGGI